MLYKYGLHWYLRKAQHDLQSFLLIALFILISLKGMILDLTVWYIYFETWVCVFLFCVVVVVTWVWPRNLTELKKF